MFLKPFRVKTQNAIKGSDRKKLRAALGKRYASIPAEKLTELVPNKEEMTVAKIHCHNGQDIIAYCLKKNPIFFDVDEVVYPSVYLLWQFPELLPSFATWPQVLPKIQGGADLMLPGVVVRGEITPKSLGVLKKGAVSAINLVGNKAPIAVGRTAMSTQDMVLYAGMKGKGIIIAHCFGDYLWSFGDKSEPPLMEDPDASLHEEEPVGSSDEMDRESPMAEEGDENIHDTAEESISTGLSTVSMEGDVDVESQEQMEESSLSPQEQMDELVEWCFYCALKKNIKKTDLPILTSNFYRNHMLPCCPKGKTIDIKKSSHKKLSKFLAAMKKREFISLKQQKDVESITEIHKSHPDLRDIDVSDVEIASPAGGNVEESEAATIFSPPVITEVYLVTGNVLPLFKSAGIPKGTSLSVQEIRKLLLDYARENELLQDVAKGFVILDPILTDVLLHKSEYIETLRYDELTSRCVNKMTLAHYLSFNGKPPVLKKGKLEPIEIKIVKRMGKKQVTLIDNLEVYGIDPQELAHSVQVGVACSTSVSPAMAGSGSQVMVQGNQIGFLADLLIDKYKLQRKWISGLEKAPKGKRR